MITPQSASEIENVLGAARNTEEVDPKTSAELVLAVADAHSHHHPIEQRIELLNRAVTAAERAGDDRLLARAFAARGTAALLAGRLAEAASDGERAARIATATHATREAVDAELLLARVAVDRVNLEEAHARALRAVEIATDDSRGRALYVLGWIETQRGDAPASEVHLSRALSAARDRHDLTTQGLVLTALAELAQIGARVEEAVDLHGRAVQVARETGNRPLEALAGLNRAYALAEIPDYERSAAHALDAMSVARALGDRRLEVLALACVGFAQQGRGRLDEALAATTSAVSQVAGDYAAIVARTCHAAVLGERRSFTEAKATFAALFDGRAPLT